MKVIICFGSMRVVVPCGDGELTVKDLMDKARQRYRKTLENSSGVHVEVLKLKTLDNNALLDPSDRVVDVVDDKEQLVAAFTLSHDHRNGDGMSAGSPSPELLRPFHLYGKDFSEDFDPMTEAIVTPHDIASQNHNLVVRRCSDESIPTSTSTGVPQHLKSSSLPSQMPDGVSYKHARRKGEKKTDPQCPVVPTFGHSQNPRLNGSLNEFTSNSTKTNHFARHSSVKSLSSSHDSKRRDGSSGGGGVRSNRIDVDRKSNFCPGRQYQLPLEYPVKSYKNNNNNMEVSRLQEKVVSTKDMLGISTSNLDSEKEKFVIKLKKSSKGLGFSVTTQDNKTNENDSLIFVKKILPVGSAVEDGRLQPGDCILEVNGVSMTGKPQEEVVAILRQIGVGETTTMLVVRSMKSPCIPPSNTTLGQDVTNDFEGRTKLHRDDSKDIVLHEKNQMQRCQQDTDSVLSFESETRSSRPQFAREGLGRQSMSEKRKGHVDPRTTETFGKIESRRSERKGNANHSRSGSMDSILDRGYVLKPVVFPPSIEGGALGSFRSRAMNYSFRAAIDKCIEGEILESTQTDKLNGEKETTMSAIEDAEQKNKQKGNSKNLGTILRFGKIKKSYKLA